MAEGLRIVLVALVGATLVVAVVFEATGIHAADAWAAFSSVTGLLVGQHLDKPTRGWGRPKQDGT